MASDGVAAFGGGEFACPVFAPVVADFGLVFEHSGAALQFWHEFAPVDVAVVWHGVVVAVAGGRTASSTSQRRLRN